ncbi:hypothetical protein BS47DRAFT_1398118 [Hydnum rufescens UP504]|uniref:Uncharacterized protein n=1 Tax=Hydnum rufescens UP504 TaxID=1448309 RepID=A0A9P6ALI4_9AGAM|nr:hypothetical protein BS47DRAFT_1398118 [Hydnum rufescens UP504]
MPMPSSRDAPKFTGRNLREFLVDYEMGTGEAGWDESQKCKQLPLYCKKAVRDLISTFEEVTSGHGWDALKKRLSDLYQPDYHKPHYTRRDIERFIKKKWIISKHSHFAQYYCDFMTKVQYVRPKPLNSEDKNLFFWEGLPRSLQKDIYEDLKISNPNLDQSVAQDVDIIKKIALSILDKDSVYSRITYTRSRTSDFESDDSEDDERETRKPAKSKKTKKSSKDLYSDLKDSDSEDTESGNDSDSESSSEDDPSSSEDERQRHCSSRKERSSV